MPVQREPRVVAHLIDDVNESPDPTTSTKIIRSVAYCDRVLDGDSKTSREYGQVPL